MEDFAQAKSEAFASAHRKLRDELFKSGMKQKDLAAKIGVTSSTLSGNLRNESFDAWQAIVEADPALAPICAALHFEIALAFAGGDPLTLGVWLDKVSAGLLSGIAAAPKPLSRDDQLRAIRDQLDGLLGDQ